MAEHRSADPVCADQPASKKAKVDSCSLAASKETVRMMPPKIHYATVFTTDVLKSVQFYKEVFGFESTMESPEWTELHPPHSSKDMTTLSLHKSDSKNVRSTEKDSGTVALGIFVPNLAEFHAMIEKRGDVKIVKEPTKEHWGGVKSEYQCPDGLLVSVIEDSAGMFKNEPRDNTPSTGNGICHIEFPVADLARAKKFWGDTFGWTFFDFTDSYVVFNTQDKKYTVGGGLYKTENVSERLNIAAIHVKVLDIEAAIEKVKQAGGSVHKEKYEIPNVGYNAFVKDTEGNVFGLYTDKGTSGDANAQAKTSCSNGNSDGKSNGHA